MTHKWAWCGSRDRLYMDVTLEYGTGAWGQKTIDGATGRTRSLTTSSAVWIQSTNVTDRRTPDDSRLHLRIASRGACK